MVKVKKVISAILVLCIISTVLPISIIAETIDALTDTIVVNGTFQEWEYCYNTTDGTLYKQKENERIYLFEDYTVTNVFTVDDTIYVWMYGEDEEYLLADAVKESIIEDDCENDIELFATSNEAEIFNFCINNMGLNVAAASGVLANIKCESSFNPNSKGDYQNGVHTSYGICQWHNSRYTNLINWCNNNGYDHTTLTGQLNFLKYELKNSYSAVWNKLNSVTNTADGAYEAAAYWCARFEIPAGYGYWQNGQLYYGTTSIARGNSAKNTYWPKYADTVVETDTTYNASAALTYAKNHWNDGVGLCAEFVSACLTAGGIDVKILTTGSLKRFLVNNGYAVEYVVETQQGKRIKMADHNGKIASGDVIINYCIECNLCPHVALVSGCSSDGYVTYYAHNNAADGTKVWWNSSVGYPSHPNHTFKTSVLHMTGSGNVVLHTHSFNKQTDSAHPHYTYNVCSTCSEKVSLGTSLQYNCKECYPLGNVKLTRSVEKTKGTVTFYRNDVENATSYNLKVYNNSGYTKDYSMTSDTMQVSVPSSGLYFAMLTAKNTNTGETATANCESFKFVDTYTVSYNANGGKNAPASQTKIQDSDLILSTAKPSREGYVFNGWAASKNAIDVQYASGSAYTKNANMTLYAVWEPETYTIKFDANGGEGEIADVTVKYGDTVKMPKNPVYQYHYLKGWSTKKNDTEAEYKFDLDYKITSNMTLYAVWGQSTWSGSVSSSLEGTGTEADPYLISSEGDLAYLANKVNEQTVEPEYEYYKLTQNINLNFEEWTPIGVGEGAYQYFYGSFDGNGFTIADFYISSVGTCYIGLFGHVKNSEIKNLTITGAIEGFTLREALDIGAVAGLSKNTTITNCNAMNFSISGIESSTTSYSHIGCIVGSAVLGGIYDCKTVNSYIGLKSGKYEAGMIAGYSNAEIDGCTVSSATDGLFGTSSAVTAYNVGGLCGNLEATAKRCTVNAPYMSNNLKTVYEAANIGGLAGVCTGNIEICAVNFTNESEQHAIDNDSYYSSILAEGQSIISIGGMAGRITGGKIVDSKYNGKSMSATTSRNVYVGGMVGSLNVINRENLTVSGLASSSRQKLNPYLLPTKAGYTATWYTDEAFTNKYDFSQVVANDLSLYAKWEKGENEIWDGTVSEPEYDSSNKTYTITNGQELAWVAGVVNGNIISGKNFPNDITFSGYTVSLADHICLNDVTDYDNWGATEPTNTWNPIGISSTYYFAGTFEGNNYSITGMYIPCVGLQEYRGLFGYGNNAVINNISVEKTLVSAYRYAGGIVGYAKNSKIEGCRHDGKISAVALCSGGIVGAIEGGTVEFCHNNGKVSVASMNSCGGIAGYCSSIELFACYNHATVNGLEKTGGIAGEAGSGVTATSCHNYGEINGTDYVGGLFGYVHDGLELTYSYNVAEVIGDNYVGGLVGYWYAWRTSYTNNASQCYSVGFAMAYDDYEAYLFGYLTGRSSAKITISNCYAEKGILNNASYNCEDESVVSVSNVKLLSEEKMKTLSNYTGFSTYAWGVNSSINDGYPYDAFRTYMYKTYNITTETGESSVVLDRSFANVDGIIHGNADYNAFAGGIVGHSYGSTGGIATMQNTIIVADRISSIAKTEGYKSKSGYLIGNDENECLDFATTSYYASNLDISAEHIGTSTQASVDTTGTERSAGTLNTSFYKTKMGLNPYISLDNLENDETAVWVLKNGEIPELYYNVLNDIKISDDIVNGSVNIDKAQAVDGEIVTVTATPAEGFVVNAIYVNGAEIVGSTFEVSGDSTVYVTFSEKIEEYSVQVKAHDNATGTVVNLDNSDAMTLFGETDKLTANDGEEVLVNTTANEDYAVDSIYVNGEEVAGNNFIVTNDSVVTMEVVSISTEVEAITNDAEEITMTTAVVSGSVLTEGDGVTRYIKYWSTDDPTDVYTTEIMEGSGDYRVTIEDLEPGTNYCYQMTEFGQIKYFTTISEESERTDVSDEEYEAIYGPDTVSVTGVTLDKTTLSLTTGESATLEAVIEPENATNQNVTWKSSNEAVATVTDGVVTATGASSATITVTTEDGGYSAECVVTVKAATVPVTGISLDKTSVVLDFDRDWSTEITATIAPENATNKNITWRSTNTSVAEVNDGVVTAVDFGEAIIVAITDDGSFSAQCVVRVTADGVCLSSDGQKESAIYELPGVVKNVASVSYAVKTNSQRDAYIAIANKDAVLSSANYLVGSSAYIRFEPSKLYFRDGNKTVEAGDISSDETYIVSMTIDNINKVWDVVVYDENYSIVAQMETLAFRNADVENLDSIVVFDNMGADVGALRVSDVSVEYPGISSITINKTALDLALGDEAILEVEIKPDYCEEIVEWISGNENVVKVVDNRDNTASITAVGYGTTEVEAIAHGSYGAIWTATCSVVVKPPVIGATGISLDKAAVALSIGGFEQINATVAPSNATDKSVTWSSTNEGVAMVSSTGMVVGVGTGTAVIVAKANDGNHTAFCVVTVSEPTVETPAEPEITLSGTDPLTVSLTGELSGRVIVALYNDDDSMIEVQIFNAIESKTVDFKNNGSYVKVIWVESFNSITPKCEAKVKNLK